MWASQKIMNAENLAIYGARATASGIIVAINELFGKVPKAIIVTERTNNPNELYGVKVVDIENAGDFKNCTILISTPIVFHKEIASKLASKGFHDIVMINNEAEYEIMSKYFKKVKGYKLLAECESVDFNQKCKVYRARSVYDKELKTKSECIDKYITDIHAGASLCDIKIADVTDCCGLNISSKNKDYCELTATYSMWKNVRSDYKGICHYRRKLQLSLEDYRKLGGVDVVLPLPFVIYPDASVHFLRFITKSDYKILLDALKDISIIYYKAGLKLWHEPYIYNYNMLIAKEKIFDDYCEFIFDVLFKVESIFNEHGIRKTNRYLGYMGEMLTSLYFMNNSKKINIAHSKKEMLE
jgi:hypothetical protein